MTRRRALRISLSAAAGGVVVLLLVSVTLVAITVRRPFPDYAGEVTLPGLTGSVTVLRDARGVPQVYADNADDLFRAQGYVHAQDRFFEMDMRRHITAGRLSELVGPDAQALRADVVVRTLGWRRVAEQELKLLPARSRSYLDAYAAGVNDYLRSRSASSLSVGYPLLGIGRPLRRIEPWTPVDSLAWLKAMAWDLRANYTDELDRARIFPAVRDIARIEQLYPRYPYGEHAPIITGGATTLDANTPGADPSRPPSSGSDRIAGVLKDAAAQRSIAAAAGGVDSVPAMLGRGSGTGSNSWVVSGRLTASGRPILANDPHLATSIPGVWYQVGLHCRQVGPQCPFQVAGYGFAGLPGVVIGHNARVAWGLTSLGADVTDFYLEKVTGDTVLRDGRQVPLTRREETIAVAGERSVRITVSQTVHGPIVSDVIDAAAGVGRTAPAASDAPERGEAYAVSLAWTALTPGRSMEAVFRLDAATGLDDFRAAARLLDVPAQNLVYADVDGRIAYQAPGRIPLRARSDADGTWPQPGWDSGYDWRGYVPQGRLPGALDPPEGFIVAANQAVTGPGGGVTFTRDWDYGYRSQRIRTLLVQVGAGGRKLRWQDMGRIQSDTRNPEAAELVPRLRKIKVNAFTRQAVRLLDGWDYTEPTDSAAAAYYNAVWASLLDLTFADELPQGVRPDGGDRWFRVVHDLMARPRDAWWDDRRTPGVVEARDEILRRALVEARLQLTSTLGKDPDQLAVGPDAPAHPRAGPARCRGIPGAGPATGQSRAGGGTRWRLAGERDGLGRR